MSDVRIQVQENGPYLVFGPVSLTDHKGEPVPVPEGKKVIALCRCGGSTTKPFCDGTHSAIGFRGAREAVDQTDDPA